MSKVLFLLFFVPFSVFAAPSAQSECRYWIEYFDRLAYLERLKQKALADSNFEEASYVASVIRRDILDVNDQTEDE